jgi:fructose-1-phosphate kinase PfkB-like protein
MSMIVTLTPNPSLDRTVEIDELRRGEVHRATGGRVDPGGKGVNVSRALAACDIATIAVLPVRRPEGAQLAALLAPFGVQTVQVPIGGTVRSNITVAEPDGTTTKLNEAGPSSAADEAAAVERTVVELAPRASWVVGAGKPAARARRRLLRPAHHGPAGTRHPGVHRRRAGPRSPRPWTRART